jgi:hypothetical protein
MKSLYESILDDEDVLVNNVKKDMNNPFFHIATLIANKIDYRPLKKELMKWLNRIEIPFDGYWEVTKEFIIFTLDDSNSKKKSSRNDRKILYISNAQFPRRVYKVPDTTELIVMVMPSNNISLLRALKYLNIKDYDKKMDELVKKYNLNYHSSEDQIVKVYII